MYIIYTYIFVFIYVYIWFYVTYIHICVLYIYIWFYIININILKDSAGEAQFSVSWKMVVCFGTYLEGHLLCLVRVLMFCEYIQHTDYVY